MHLHLINYRLTFYSFKFVCKIAKLLKELEDFEWFPSLLRQYQMDFIGFVVAQFKVYQPFIDYIKQVPKSSDNWVDWCSGSGEPAISIFQKVESYGHLELSDKYPSSYHGKASNITYNTQSVDVLSASVLSGKTYTMFNAFHHFEKSEQIKIVNRIKENHANAFFVEILAPDFLFYLKILFTTTIGTLLLTPFIQPFSFKRLFFTYIIPINILTITYDGLVSVYKSKSVKQYQQQFETCLLPTAIFELKKGPFKLIVIEVKP